MLSFPTVCLALSVTSLILCEPSPAACICPTLDMHYPVKSLLPKLTFVCPCQMSTAFPALRELSVIASTIGFEMILVSVFGV